MTPKSLHPEIMATIAVIFAAFHNLQGQADISGNNELCTGFEEDFIYPSQGVVR